MSSRLASALRIGAIVMLLCIIVWGLTSNDQRRRLIVAFGIADSLQQAERIALTLVGPGFEIELLPAVPPPRTIDRSPPQLAAAVTRPSSAAAASPPPEIASHVLHAGDPCASGRPANPSRARPAAGIYRWTDDQGRVVFSDRAAPAAMPISAATADGSGVGRFSAEYDYKGVVAPTAFQQQLEIDIDGVFRFLAEDLGLRDVQAVHVRLQIIDQPERFPGLLAGTGLAGGRLSGVYRYRDNQAIVRWQGPNRTRAVARHEIAHLALGNWLGRVPLWLNEGLAELVERMRFQQSFASAEAPPRQIARLGRLEGRGRLPALRTFLAAERSDWDRWGHEITYPYAWSLVYFLVQEPAREQVLSRLLNALAQHRCTAFDDIGHLAATYPGGLRALERDWRRWLHGGRIAAVQW